MEAALKSNPLKDVFVIITDELDAPLEIKVIAPSNE